MALKNYYGPAIYLDLLDGGSLLGGPSAAELIRRKHKEYVRLAKLNSVLYYATRLLAGISASLLPFTLAATQRWLPTSLSAIILITIVIDFVLGPRERWALYSKATDLLTVASLRSDGEFEDNKEALEILLKTEAAPLKRLVDMRELLSIVERQSTRDS